MLSLVVKQQQNLGRSKTETTSRLRNELEKNLSRDGGGPPKRGSMVRVSSLGGLCGRAVVLARKTGCQYSHGVDSELMWTFGIGTAYHRQFQRDWLMALYREDGESVLNGWWKCTKCSALHVGLSNDEHETTWPPDVHARVLCTVPSGHPPMTDALKWGWISRPHKCLSCNSIEAKFSNGESSLFEYVEISLYSKSKRLSGHVDGVLVWLKDDVELLELKTIGSNGFESVQPVDGGGPKPEHVVQLTAYQMLTGVHRGRFVYIMKSDRRMKDCMVEHGIGYDEELSASIVESVAKYVEILDAEQNDELPVRKSGCYQKSKAPALYCACNVECFKTPT